MSRILRTRRARLTAASGTLLVTALVAATLSGSAGPAHADPADSSNTVTVSGTGRASGTPDVMHVDLGVQRSGADLNATLNEANADLARIKDALSRHGVAEKDIQTSQLSVNQHYGPIQPVPEPANTATPAVAPDAPVAAPGVAVAPPMPASTPAYIGPKDQNDPNGYDVYETVAVTLRNLADAGATISDAAAAGGDATRINGVTFTIEDQSALLAQARDAAFADAKAKAEQYAKLAGRSLGRVSVITEGTSSGGGVIYPMERSAMSAGAPVPVSPGSQDVTLTTNVTWELN
jgi:uncharacterized protein YggE